MSEPEPPQKGETMTLDQAFQRGFAHHQAGRLQDAENVYRQILAANPNHPETLNFLALLGHTSGHQAKALELVDRALSLKPKYTHAHTHRGIILNALGRKEDALASFETALKLEPGAPEIGFNCAAVLHDLGRLDEAAERLQEVLKIDPTHQRALNNLGLVQRERGKSDQARELFQHILTQNPKAFEAHFNLSAMALEAGNQTDAEHHVREALRLNPTCGEAHLSLARMKTFHGIDEDVQAMERTFEETSNSLAERLPTAFALGKAYEDLGAFEKSFACYAEGNRIKRQTLNLDFTQLSRDLDHVANAFTPDVLDRVLELGQQEPTPIFIVGMPRSGSTLVEQILSSHPDISGVGEVTFLADVIRENLGTYGEIAGHIKDNPDVQVRLADIARHYLERLRASAPNSALVCDKMLGNFANIGLIKMMFPKAKVIHCRRNAMDTCWSMYKTLFSDNSLVYTYDLGEIGHYYKSYVELMRHWHDVLADFIYDIDYENLIQDQDGQTRALIDFVGVDWNDACLDFHRTQRSVKTASVTQVRQPIYQDSVKRWKNYEPWLGPLMKALGD